MASGSVDSRRRLTVNQTTDVRLGVIGLGNIGKPIAKHLLQDKFQLHVFDVFRDAVKELEAAKLTPRLMVDCSHANSRKDPTNQPTVARDLAHQISQGENAIAGITNARRPSTEPGFKTTLQPNSAPSATNAPSLRKPELRREPSGNDQMTSGLIISAVCSLNTPIFQRRPSRVLLKPRLRTK